GIPIALKTKRVAVTEETLVKEGNRPIQVTAIPFQDGDGEWLVAEVNVDISERKRTEKALRKAHEELEIRVRERTAELAQANKAMQAEINERKPIEDALRESEERYRSFVENFQGIAYRGRMDFVPIFFHGAVEAITGYKEEEFLAGNPRWDQMIHPDDLSKIHESFQKIHSTPSYSATREYRILRKDGKVKWIHEQIQNICDSSGNPIMLQGALYDITERKRAEEALLNAAQQWRTTFDGISDIVCLLGQEGRIIKCNKALTDLLGKPFSEIINRTHLEILHGAPMPIEECPVERLWKTHRRETDILLINDRWFSISVDPLLDGAGRLVGAVHIMSDVTEGKKAEEALRQSEEKYRTIIENMQEAYYELDPAGHFTFVNDALCKHLGYTKDELIGTRARQYQDEKTTEKMHQIFTELYRTGEPVKALESEYIQKDGTKGDYELSVSLIRDPEGKPIGFRGVSRNVTERKKAEEALRQSEERYRNILESIQEGYFETDLAGNYTFVNNANCNFLGYTKEELVGMNFRQHSDEKTVKTLRTHYIRLYLTGNPIEVLDVEAIRKDGTKTIYETSVSLIRNSEGKPIGFRGVSRDVTERKRAEETLQKSEERYRTIIENIQDGYFENDLAGDFTFVNDALCRDLGYSREELIGMDYRQYTDEKTAMELFRDYNRLYRTGEPIKLLEIGRIGKDGKKSFAEISTSVIRDSEGKPIGFRGISRDITERKRIEEQLLNAAQQWRKTFDGISDIVCLLDREGRILKCNKALTHLLGKPFSEIINRTHLEIVHGAPMPIEESPVERLWKTHHRETDILLINDRWFSIAVDPLLDEAGRLVGAVYIMSDVTERRRAEEAIRESEKRYRQVIENAVDIIYTTDANGNFTYANSAALTTTGYSLEELQRFNYLDLILPEHRDRVSKIYIGQFRERQATTYVEFPFFNKSGDVLWFGQNASLVIEREKHIGFHVIARDITDRKRVEQALRESEERYRALYDRSLDCVFVLDFDGKFVDANQAALGLLEYDKTDISSVNIASLIDERDLSKALQNMNEMIQTGFQKEITEYRLRRKHGGIVYVETQGSVIYRDGKPHSIQGIARDITERKQAEEALRQSEEKYRTILENMQEAYYEIDLAGHLTFFNDALCKHLGYPKEELIGRVYRQYQDETTAKKIYQLYNEVYRTGEPVRAAEAEYIRKDGTKGTYELSVSLLRDTQGKPIGFRGISRDVTERKQAEEALRLSEERYRNIIENIQDGYFEDDLAGNFTFVNDVICRHLGYTKEELIGMNYRKYASEENSKELYQHFSELYRTGQPIKPFAVEYIRRDRTKLISEISISLIRNSEGKPIGFRGISRDITERKQAEEEKLSLQEQLRQSQKMEAIGQLAGGVAHDFNNLLTVIKGYSQLSLLDLKEDNPLWGNIQEIEKATQRATDLTRQLLAFSRRQILDLRVLDLNILLTDLDKMLRRIIGEDIELVTLLSKDLGKVKIDPSQIEQVIFNLAVNARDAMPSGGKLTIETANVELDEEYAHAHVNVTPGRYVRLSI
ncbi:MAG: PAS domain S-box protein, partial [Syntrophales bacterium]